MAGEAGHSVDVLEFIQRSEWPVVALVAITVLHKPIARLIDRVRPTKFSAWGISVELDKVEVLTEETRAITKDEAPRQLERPRSDVLTFGTEDYDHPQLVILKSWTALERALYRASGKVEVSPSMPQWISARDMEMVAKELGLTRNELDAIRELRNVRNRVAHEIDFPVTSADAVRFAELSRDLVVRIEAAAKQIQRPTT